MDTPIPAGTAAVEVDEAAQRLAELVERAGLLAEVAQARAACRAAGLQPSDDEVAGYRDAGRG
jgi:hypothetical protein